MLDRTVLNTPELQASCERVADALVAHAEQGTPLPSDFAAEPFLAVLKQWLTDLDDPRLAETDLRSVTECVHDFSRWMQEKSSQR